MKYVKVKKDDVDKALSGFSTFDINNMFGIKRGSTQQAMDRGFVKPSIMQAYGKGSRNRFSVDDLFRLLLFRDLSESGLSQKQASKVASKTNFANVGEEISKNYLLLIYDERRLRSVNQLNLHDYIATASKSFRRLIVIDLLSIVNQVQTAIQDQV